MKLFENGDELDVLLKELAESKIGGLVMDLVLGLYDKDLSSEALYFDAGEYGYSVENGDIDASETEAGKTCAFSKRVKTDLRLLSNKV